MWSCYVEDWRAAERRRCIQFLYFSDHFVQLWSGNPWLEFGGISGLSGDVIIKSYLLSDVNTFIGLFSVESEMVMHSIVGDFNNSCSLTLIKDRFCFSMWSFDWCNAAALDLVRNVSFELGFSFRLLVFFMSVSFWGITCLLFLRGVKCCFFLLLLWLLFPWRRLLCLISSSLLLLCPLVLFRNWNYLFVAVKIFSVWSRSCCGACSLFQLFLSLLHLSLFF